MESDFRKPNVVYVFSDQHRAQACGYAGDPNVKTPVMDYLKKESISFPLAVSNTPVCCPARASMLTGRYAHTHGVIINDLCLSNDAISIAQAFKNADYDTAYIGKWHLDGHGRSSYIPPERRQGFEYWSVLECTHDYNHSSYYHNDNVTPNYWEEYDAISQTKEAIQLLKQHTKEKPLFLMLSWGPPHNPYETAPEKYRMLYESMDIELRENVHPFSSHLAKKELAGYYAHITALDDCLGELMAAIRAEGMEEDTIFIYTSDHGDMLHSQGVQRKQSPWDESILVPFLMRAPKNMKLSSRQVQVPFSTPDIMPTILDMCGIQIPKTVEGRSFLPLLKGQPFEEKPALIQSFIPNGEWHKFVGGRAYRGIRTQRYTFIRDLHEIWLCYDNQNDPFQLRNLAEEKGHDSLFATLDVLLNSRLEELDDEFLPGEAYIEKWNYNVDPFYTVPINP